MNMGNRFLPLAMTALAVLAFADAAFAEIGRKVSVTSGNSGLISSFPTFTDAAIVGVPSSYKSKANFLKVTTSYSASCSGGDYMGSKVSIDGIEMTNSGVPFEALDEDASSQIVTKQYYLVPESMGGPAVAPDSEVTLKITSQYGTGCSFSNVTMVVEAVK